MWERDVNSFCEVDREGKSKLKCDHADEEYDKFESRSINLTDITDRHCTEGFH